MSIKAKAAYPVDMGTGESVIICYTDEQGQLWISEAELIYCDED